MPEKSKMDVIMEQWELGSDENKAKFAKYRDMFEIFAFNCMIAWERGK